MLFRVKVLRGSSRYIMSMDSDGEMIAWLEAEGEKTSVSGICTFGRTPGNTVVLPTEKASRRHAMIHEQDGEFWIVDLGSTNGIKVNGERVTHPVRLANGNHIVMPGIEYVFHQEIQKESRRAPPLLSHSKLTVADIQLSKCWILVADVEGFTKMSQQVAAEELAPLVGQWMAHCQEIVKDHKGVLAKFLGDGFLAYWTDRDGKAASIASACRKFQELQKSGALPFRVMVHYGMVSFGGHSPDASHTMIGPELNFAFRLEKVAARLNISWIFSDTAADHLKDNLTLKACGRQKVPDFPQERICFTLK